MFPFLFSEHVSTDWCSKDRRTQRRSVHTRSLSALGVDRVQRFVHHPLAPDSSVYMYLHGRLWDTVCITYVCLTEGTRSHKWETAKQKVTSLKLNTYIHPNAGGPLSETRPKIDNHRMTDPLLSPRKVPKTFSSSAPSTLPNQRRPNPMPTLRGKESRDVMYKNAQRSVKAFPRPDPSVRPRRFVLPIDP